MFKRVIAMILALTLVLPAVPVSAAESDESTESLRVSDEFSAAHPFGSFSLKSAAIETHEDSGRVVTEVLRRGGASGEVTITLKALDVSAKIGQDYTLSIPKLFFSTPVKSESDTALIESDGTDDPLIERDGTESVYKTEEDTESAASEVEEVHIAQEAYQVDPDSVKATSVNGLQAVREQAAGVPSDRSKFTYTEAERSELVHAAALAAEDYYNEAPGTELTLTFGDGERKKSLYIDLIDDNLPEGEEQMILVITGISGGGEVGTQRETIVNILDDEPYEKPVISFSSKSYAADGESAEITLLRTAGLYYYAGGTVYTANGSALAGENYTALNQKFLFIPGQKELKLSVPVTANTGPDELSFSINIVVNESCTVSGDDSVQVRISAEEGDSGSGLTSLSSMGTDSLALLTGEETAVTLGIAKTVYTGSDDGAGSITKNFERTGSSLAQVYRHGGGWYETKIVNDSIEAGVTLKRTLYKSMLESVVADMNLFECGHENHFDVWIDAYYKRLVTKKVSVLGTTVNLPTFANRSNLFKGRDGYDKRYTNKTVMNQSTSGIGSDPFELSLLIHNGKKDYGAMRLYSVTLNYRHFKIKPLEFHDDLYTFDFSKEIGEYTKNTVTPGAIEIRSSAGVRVDGFYTSENEYALYVTTKDVLPGYYLKELRFYNNTDSASPATKSLPYPMGKNGGIIKVDNEFLQKYAPYTVDGGSGARTFLIQPVFARDPASLTVSMNDADRSKGEILGVDFDASAASKIKKYTRNNTDKYDLKTGDKVILTSAGFADNAVTGYYLTTGDGSVSGKKTEAVGEHDAGILSLTLAKENVVTPIFGDRLFEVKPDPDANPSLTGMFSIDGGSKFTGAGKLTGIKSGQSVDVAVIPPAGYTTQWANRSGDTNGNGVLDPDEIRDENDVLFRQYDYNGDGYLDEDYKTTLHGDLFCCRINQPRSLFYYNFIPLSGMLRYTGPITGYVKTREYNIYLDDFTQAVDNNGKKYDKLVPVSGATVTMGGTYDPSIPGAQIAYGTTTDSNGKFSFDVAGVLKNSSYFLSIKQNDASFFVDSITPSVSGSNYMVPPFASMRPTGVSAYPVSSKEKNVVMGSVVMIKDNAEVTFELQTASLEGNVKVEAVDFRVYNRNGTLKSSTVEPVSMNRSKYTVVLDKSFEQNDVLMVQLIDQNGGRTIEYNTGYNFRPPLPKVFGLPSFVTPVQKSIPLFDTVMGSLDLGNANSDHPVSDSGKGEEFTIKLGHEHAFDDYEKVLKDTISDAEQKDSKGKAAREKITSQNDKAEKKTDTNVKTKSTVGNKLSVKLSMELGVKYDPDRDKSAGSPYYFGHLMLLATMKDQMVYETTVVLPVGLSIVSKLTFDGTVTGFLRIDPVTEVGALEPLKNYVDEYGNFEYTNSNMFKAENYRFHAEGGLILQPNINLKITGTYGMASVSVTGNAEFFLIFTTDHKDRGTVTLDADISVDVMGMNVYDKSLSGGDHTYSLFGLSGPPLLEGAPEQTAFAPIPRAYIESRSSWLGEEALLTSEGPGASDFSERSLLSGVYPYPESQVARIDEDSLLLVFVDDHPGRSIYNRAALYYSISHDNGVTYSEPALLSDDGTLDSRPRLVDLGDRILCLYSSLSDEIAGSTSMEEILELTGLEMRFFDKTTGRFEGVATAVTRFTGKEDPEHEGALMGDYTSDGNGTAVYDENTGRVLILYTKSDYTSDEGRTFSAGDLFDAQKSYSAAAYRIYDTVSGEFLSYQDLGYPDGIETADQKAYWDEYWYGQKFLDTEIVDSSMPDGGIADPLVYDLTAAYKDGTAYIAYTVDLDNDLSTAEDRDIYLSTYRFEDNAFAKAVKASDVYKDLELRADGRPQLVFYEDTMYLFYTSGTSVCYVEADLLFLPRDSDDDIGGGDDKTVVKALPSKPLIALADNKQNHPAEDYRVLVGDDGKLYLIWTEGTLRYADGVAPGSQEALDAKNIFHESQIYAAIYYEDYEANLASDFYTGPEMVGTSKPGVRYGIWSDKVQLTAGPGSYSDISTAVMENGRILITAKKSEVNLPGSTEDAPLRSNPDTAELVAITLTPRDKAEMTENDIFFGADFPGAGKPVLITGAFHNRGLMPLANSVIEFFAVSDGVLTSIGLAETGEPIYGGRSGAASIEWTAPDDLEGLSIEAQLRAGAGGSVLARSRAKLPYGVDLEYNLLNLTYVAQNYYRVYAEVRHSGNQPMNGAELVISRVEAGNVYREIKRVSLKDAITAEDYFTINETFTLSASDLDSVSGVLGGSAPINVRIEKDGTTLVTRTGTVTKNIINTYGEYLSEAGGVELSESNLSMARGDKHTLSATVALAPDSAAVAGEKFNIVYRSSDPAVASVNNSGVITAHAGGIAVITAYAVPNVQVRMLTVDGYKLEGSVLEDLALEDCPSDSLQVDVYNKSGGSQTPQVQKPISTGFDLSVKAMMNGTNHAEASVTEQQISDAVREALGKLTGETSAPQNIRINVDAPAGARTIDTVLPAAAFDQLAGSGFGLTVSTAASSIAFDKSALKGILAQATGEIIITSSRVDNNSLTEPAKSAAAGRPVFDFSVSSGSRSIAEFGGNAVVSIPYLLSNEEEADSLIIYLIKEDDELVCVSNCRYDAASKSIIFVTNHFSRYAVGYNKVSFGDVVNEAWYHQAVGFLAARGITTGTGDGSFNPNGALTRGQFLTMLMRTYGIAPVEDAADNFVDAGDTYYTGYLAAAKRLGITAGVGNNRFEPEQAVRRQEMFVLLYNTLKSIDQLPAMGSKINTDRTGSAAGLNGDPLKKFSDSSEIAAWAQEPMAALVESGTISGMNGKLEPSGGSTRAQMAQVVYNLISK